MKRIVKFMKDGVLKNIKRNLLHK